MAQLQWNIQQPFRLRGKDIIAKVRLKAGDSIVKKYSDYEILASINEGIDILWRELAQHFSTITHKVVEYTLNGGDLLPHDFYSLVDIQDLEPHRMPLKIVSSEYAGRFLDTPHIEGDHIYGRGHVRLIYNYFPRDITLPDSVIDIPLVLQNDLVAIVAMLIAGDGTGAQNRAEGTAGKLSQRREYARPSDWMAFP